MTAVMAEMLKCCDEALTVRMFGKMHRPEEQAKLALANERLVELRAQYPVSWSKLKRILGRR